jgi:NTP pyrophosphatase (non-canonical NTP hydrolase)
MSDDILEMIGTAALLEQLAEESAELAQAAIKTARKIRNENPTPKSRADCVANLQEEIADVELCISILPAALHDPAEVGKTMAAKHRRWNGRLHDEKLWEVSNHED